MWVVTVGPFRGKRARTAKILGLAVLLILLVALFWQMLDVMLSPPQHTEPLAETVFQRILIHLRNWYTDGF
ncbi:MAG: hypothetical protein DDT37_00453 [Firmicutes bacterium]|nr:hypothetical protein [candidate division NPL-UPA2 bacterium]